MSKIITFLKRLIGRILMRATYWTAIGTMLIPLGIVLVLAKPEWAGYAYWLIIFGFASFAVGWYYTIREERRQQRDEQRRQEEHELRLRGEKTSLLILGHIAESLGVNMDKVAKDVEKMLDGK